MKRAIRNLVASGAFVAVAAPGLSGCGDEEQSSYANTGDKALVEYAVMEAGTFWENHGIEGAKDLHAEVVVGSGSIACGEYTVTSATGDMRYCGNKTVAVSLAALNSRRANDGDNADITIQAWAREAVGGYVQEKDSEMLALAPGEDSEQHAIYPEAQRTCLSGMATQSLAPDQTAVAFQGFLHTGPDYATEGHALAWSYAHGYGARDKENPEQPSTDPHVCIDLPMLKEEG
jgi:hypothetical protein